MSRFSVLAQIQNDLFDAGADLSTPVVENPEHPPLRITQSYIDRLESWCDEFNEPLAPPEFLCTAGWFGALSAAARRPHHRATGRTVGVERAGNPPRHGQRAVRPST